jgi:hypothetical protein
MATKLNKCLNSLVGVTIGIGVIFACCFVVSAADVQGKVTSYGLFKVSGKEEVVNSPETPSGITRIPAYTPILITPTDRVPAKI